METKLVTKYFGPVRALIDDQSKRVTIGFGPRRGPRSARLLDSEVLSCQVWAIESMEELQDAGYVLHFVDGEVK